MRPDREGAGPPRHYELCRYARFRSAHGKWPKVVLTVFPTPPRMDAPAPLEVFDCPPLTDANWLEARLALPPLIAAHGPVAVLRAP